MLAIAVTADSMRLIALRWLLDLARAHELVQIALLHRPTRANPRLAEGASARHDLFGVAPTSHVVPSGFVGYRLPLAPFYATAEIMPTSK